MTPADELRAAAEKLRTTCAAAAPGPWTIAKVPPYTDPLLMSRLEETPDDEDVLIVGTVDLELEDAAVVQLLHPGVGLVLADWLNLFANTEFDPAADVQETDRSHECALAVARAINGATR